MRKSQFGHMIPLMLMVLLWVTAISIGVADYMKDNRIAETEHSLEAGEENAKLFVEHLTGEKPKTAICTGTLHGEGWKNKCSVSVGPENIVVLYCRTKIGDYSHKNCYQDD